MNDNYQGEKIEDTYYYDTLVGKELLLENQIDLSQKDVLLAQKEEKIHPQACWKRRKQILGAKLEELLRKIQIRQSKIETNRVVENFVNELVDELKNAITEKEKKEIFDRVFSKAFDKHMTPWLLHLLKSHEKNKKF